MLDRKADPVSLDIAFFFPKRNQDPDFPVKPSEFSWPAQIKTMQNKVKQNKTQHVCETALTLDQPGQSSWWRVEGTESRERRGASVTAASWQPALVAWAGGAQRRRSSVSRAAWPVYRTPAGSIWKALRGRPRAGSRLRVNNQPECFSKHADPEPPGWGAVPGSLRLPDI